MWVFFGQKYIKRLPFFILQKFTLSNVIALSKKCFLVVRYVWIELILLKIENWKYNNKIIFKYVNSTVEPIFNFNFKNKVVVGSINSAWIVTLSPTQYNLLAWTVPVTVYKRWEKKEKKKEKRKHKTQNVKTHKHKRESKPQLTLCEVLYFLTLLSTYWKSYSYC